MARQVLVGLARCKVVLRRVGFGIAMLRDTSEGEQHGWTGRGTGTWEFLIEIIFPCNLNTWLMENLEQKKIN